MKTGHMKRVGDGMHVGAGQGGERERKNIALEEDFSITVFGGSV